MLELEERQEIERNQVVRGRYQASFPEAALLIKAARKLYARQEELAKRAQLELRKKHAQRIYKTYLRAKDKGQKLVARRIEAALLKSQLELQRKYQEAVLESREECLEVALKVAKEVIQAELKTNTKSILSRVSKALKNLAGQSKVRVHLCALDELALAKYQFDTKVEFTKNPTLEPGKALIETICGELLVDWELHFSLLQEALRARLQGRTVKLKSELR